MILNVNSIVQQIIQNTNKTIKHVNANVKKDYSWNPRKCILSIKKKYYGNRCHVYCFNKL